jgi:hypothetical protein
MMAGQSELNDPVVARVLAAAMSVVFVPLGSADVELMLVSFGLANSVTDGTALLKGAELGHAIDSSSLVPLR